MVEKMVKTVETSATPHLKIVECLGNLMVRGRSERQITLLAQGGEDDVSFDQQGESFTLHSRAGCIVHCPPAATLEVISVHGNLQVEGLTGPVTIQTVHGNTGLRELGPVAIQDTFGNLRAHDVAGDLTAGVTRGNARISRVAGRVTLGRVDGNLLAEDLQDALRAEQVRGNARLAADFPPGTTYQLNTNGNLKVRIPEEVGLRVILRADGGARSALPQLPLERQNGEIRGVMGNGEASLEAWAGGHILLEPLDVNEPSVGLPGMNLDFTMDFEGLGAQIETTVAAAMTEMAARLEESLGRIGRPEFHQQAAEHARRVAEREAERARRAAEREAERARIWAERAERRWQRASGQPPRARRSPVTDEERMQVLRMVEAGKITPEQAAELLAALEGK